jgi:hypothetical protein
VDENSHALHGEGSYNFKHTGHDVLCCVGNLNRVIPNYVMHLWMGTADYGLAATLYGPSVINTVAGRKDIPIKIISDTHYPFEETIHITVEPAKTCTFPLYLRIPEWCRKPEITVNDEPVYINSIHGFTKIDRKWKKGDRIDLNLPMHVEVIDGRETPYPRIDYYVKGSSAHRVLPLETNVNSPYRTILYGPLLFALAVKDIQPDKQSPDVKWNYALISENENDIKVEHSAMPAVWSWQIEDAPVKLKAKAGVFDWQPTHTLPLPENEVKVSEDTYITLVPYGCTKFRISMFPICQAPPGCPLSP